MRDKRRTQDQRLGGRWKLKSLRFRRVTIGTGATLILIAAVAVMAGGGVFSGKPVPAKAATVFPPPTVLAAQSCSFGSVATNSNPTMPPSIAPAAGTTGITAEIAAGIARRQAFSGAPSTPPEAATAPAYTQLMSYASAAALVKLPITTGTIAGSRCVWLTTVHAPLPINGPAPISATTRSSSPTSVPSYSAIVDQASGKLIAVVGSAALPQGTDAAG